MSTVAVDPAGQHRKDRCPAVAFAPYAARGSGRLAAVAADRAAGAGAAAARQQPADPMDAAGARESGCCCSPGARARGCARRRPWCRPSAVAGVAGLALVVLVALLQMAPYLPRDWQHPLWLQAAGVLGDQARGRISVNPHVTGTALMLLLTYAGVFWLALQLSRSAGRRAPDRAGPGARRPRLRAYGLLVFLLDLSMVLWWRKWTWMTGLTSSFVNRNTYATYAGLGLLCAVGLLITTVYRDLRSRRFRRLPWRVRLRADHLARLVAGRRRVCLALRVDPDGSRGGVASSAVALAVLIAASARPG